MENSRFKFRVWDKGNKRYQGTQDWQPYLDTDGDVCFINTDDVRDYPPENYFIIEQCTGLKDKNGKLIYEGDVIKDTGEIKYQIMWKDARFVAVAIKEFDYMPDNLLNQKWIDVWKHEIIGNIHEQAEQKDK